MGSIVFEKEVLADSLSETVGYKAGLALSIEQICDHLSGTRYPDLILMSEQGICRMRSEEYEDLFFKLLHRVGYTKEEYNGDSTGIWMYHKYRDSKDFSAYEGVTEIFIKMWPELVQAAVAMGVKKIDPEPFMRQAVRQFGKIGLQLAVERIQVLNNAVNLSPHSGVRFIEWAGVQELTSLFAGSKNAPDYGAFFDQRFIDYLSVNPDMVNQMHWRKFEEMTAEYFHREGFTVELGPGGNDDGVDVRIWRPGAGGTAPHGIVQCKRQKDKIEKVIVKSLMADLTFEKADIGLIVTSSELSPGAKKTITARGYPIQEVNKEGIVAWLSKLRSPGTGIVRG